MTTPLEFYHQQIASGEILEDSQQRAAIQKFEALYQYLIQSTPKKFTLAKKILTLYQPKQEKLPHGIYIWGDVGIGKTFLVDTFYYCLPFEKKLRIHFYQFMRKVHADLHELKDTSNPLTQIAKQWAQKARVICFDELIVNDIADAMLL